MAGCRDSCAKLTPQANDSLPQPIQLAEYWTNHRSETYEYVSRRTSRQCSRFRPAVSLPRRHDLVEPSCPQHAWPNSRRRSTSKQSRYPPWSPKCTTIRRHGPNACRTSTTRSQWPRSACTESRHRPTLRRLQLLRSASRLTRGCVITLTVLPCYQGATTYPGGIV